MGVAECIHLPLPSIWGISPTLDWTTPFQDHSTELHLDSMTEVVESETELGVSFIMAKLSILEEPVSPLSHGDSLNFQPSLVTLQG